MDLLQLFSGESSVHFCSFLVKFELNIVHVELISSIAINGALCRLDQRGYPQNQNMYIFTRLLHVLCHKDTYPKALGDSVNTIIL